MKAILEFNLDELEDEQRFKRCNKSDDMAYAIWHIVHNTKKGLQYSVEKKEIKKN
jgi:hypothetical protein